MRTWAVWLVLAGCGDNLPARPPEAGLDVTCTPARGENLRQRRIAFGCTAPGAPPAPNCIDDTVVLATSPPADPRLFAVERNGVIRILIDEQLQPEPFAKLGEDDGGPVHTDGNEMGLLGLAFHPAFAVNRTLYVFYTALNTNPVDAARPFLDVLARYTVDAADPARLDRASGEVLLEIPDPFSNHNGGMIEFGADGDLYISTGDGGNGGDPMGNAQNPNALLGKILRIDIDREEPGKRYAIPADNPYAASGGAPEVFLLGLRNPWRWSFDRATGDMWIGDVGQSEEEELDFLPAGHQVGANLGWNMFEGNRCYSPPCDIAGKTFPIDARARTPTPWWSIIGGQVYRGSCFPDLVGWHVYTDCGYGGLVKARVGADGSRAIVDVANTFIPYPTSLHADARGELYETSLDGSVYRIEAAP